MPSAYLTSHTYADDQKISGENPIFQVHNAHLPYKYSNVRLDRSPSCALHLHMQDASSFGTESIPMPLIEKSMGWHDKVAAYRVSCRATSIFADIEEC
jgi:hypothetical protein